MAVVDRRKKLATSATVSSWSLVASGLFVGVFGVGDMPQAYKPQANESINSLQDLFSLSIPRFLLCLESLPGGFDTLPNLLHLQSSLENRHKLFHAVQVHLESAGL